MLAQLGRVVLLPAVAVLVWAAEPQIMPAGDAAVWVERETYVMGTRLRATVAGDDAAAAVAAIEQVFTAVRIVDARLSTWRDDTELRRLNRAPVGVPQRLSPSLFALLREVRRWRDTTGGAFDPAIGALVDAWDLRGVGRRPGPADLVRARRAGGMERLPLDEIGRSARRTAAAAWIDAGAFGKGAALREARRVLDSAGVRAALLNFGGQVLAVGTGRDGTAWRIPVAHPSRRGLPAAFLRLREQSAATTAQSERFVEVDGVRYGHVLDPRTGLPVPAWGSVTVVAEDPLAADILSTALFVLGPDSGMEWLEHRPGIAALFLIERDGAVTYRWTQAMEHYAVGVKASEN